MRVKIEIKLFHVEDANAKIWSIYERYSHIDSFSKLKLQISFRSRSEQAILILSFLRSKENRYPNSTKAPIGILDRNSGTKNQVTTQKCF